MEEKDFLQLIGDNADALKYFNGIKTKAMSSGTIQLEKDALETQLSSAILARDESISDRKRLNSIFRELGAEESTKEALESIIEAKGGVTSEEVKSMREEFSKKEESFAQELEELKTQHISKMESFDKDRIINDIITEQSTKFDMSDPYRLRGVKEDIAEKLVKIDGEWVFGKTVGEQKVKESDVKSGVDTFFASDLWAKSKLVDVKPGEIQPGSTTTAKPDATTGEERDAAVMEKYNLQEG